MRNANATERVSRLSLNWQWIGCNRHRRVLSGASTITFRKFRTAIYQRSQCGTFFFAFSLIYRELIAREPLFQVYFGDANSLLRQFRIRRHEIKCFFLFLFSQSEPMPFNRIYAVRAFIVLFSFTRWINVYLFLLFFVLVCFVRYLYDMNL